MPTKTCPLTPEKFASLRSQLAALGTVLPTGNSGTFFPPQHPEIELSFSYDGTANLTLAILKDAWYETAGEVWNGLAPYLA